MGQNILKIIFNIIAFVVLLNILCFVIHYLSNVDKWELDYKANIADIFNIFATIILAVLVSTYFSRRQSAEKFEKEILISDLKEIELKVRSIQYSYEKNESLSLGFVSTELNTIRTYIDRFENTYSLYQHAPLATNLKSLHMNLYTIMTNVDDDKIETNKIDIAEIQSFCNKFILETRDCMLKVNSL